MPTNNFFFTDPDGDRWKTAAYTALFFVVMSLTMSNSFFEITAAAFIVLSAFSFFKKPGVLSRPLWMGLLLLYVAVTALSVFQSDYLGVSLRGVLKVAKGAALCLCAAYVLDNERRLKNIVIWILVVAMMIGVDTAIQAMTGVELLRGRFMTHYMGATYRLTGPFRHANDFSAYLLLIFFLFVGMALEGWRYFDAKKRFWPVLGTVMAGFCMIGTYSRGAWVAAAAGALFYAVFQRSRALLAFFTLAALWALFFSPPLVRDRLHSIWDRENGTITERQILWDQSFRMIREKPLLGHGVNTYAKVQPSYKIKMERPIDNQYAHNGYLQIAAETGLLGLSALLLFYLAYFVVCIWIFSHAAGFLRVAGFSFLSGIFAFLLHSFTDTNLQSVLLVNTLWLFTGIGWAISRVAGERVRTNP